jgi:inosine-uridine nucleoside N-ribohydrolase
MKEKVILDCDNTMGIPYREVDDGLTLLYLLGRPDIEVLGITTTFGNGTIEEVHPATEDLLEAIGRENLPLFKGEAERGQPPTDAAHFLAQTVAAHPGEVNVLAIGPVGNLRAAAEMDGEFFDHVKQIAIMGGYLHPLRVGSRDVDELNLASDPEAAHRVLNASCPVTLMNAHICLQAPFREEHLSRVQHWSEETHELLRKWLEAMQVGCDVDEFYLWDLLPAVYLSYPELFDDNPTWVRSTVEDLETGTIVTADEGRGARINMPDNILDQDRFMEVLFEAWGRVEA